MRHLRVVLVLGALLSGISNVPAAANDGRGAICGQSGGACLHGLPIAQYQMLLPQMLAHPKPNARPIPVDAQALYRYSLYQIDPNGITLYDAPNGTPIGSLPQGFIFVGMRQQRDGWGEVRRGEWAPLNQLKGIPASPFSGLLFDVVPAYPIAWLLQATQPSDAPGASPEPNAPTLARYAAVYLFATTSDGAQAWHLVGPGQWLPAYRLARLIPPERPEGVKGRWIAVDLAQQVLTAYEDDQLVFATLISSGRPETATGEGLFRIWARFRWDTLFGGSGADYYYLPAVPYVMYFDGEIALHGAYWHDNFGAQHSQGCVNLSLSDARWLYEWTDNFFADTWVYVWRSKSAQ
ncbi:MAG: L,D-transpeptidase [Aggregatilineales bacterium]